MTKQLSTTSLFYFGGSNPGGAQRTQVDLSLRADAANLSRFSLVWTPDGHSKNAPSKLKENVLSIDAVYGASCVSGPPGPAPSSVLGLAAENSKLFVVCYLSYSEDPGVRYQKGYKTEWHAFEAENPGQANEWVGLIRRLARGENVEGLVVTGPSGDPLAATESNDGVAGPSRGSAPAPRALVLVNPFSGTRKAPKIYKEIVRPMLKLAGFDVDMLETKHHGHAMEIARGLKVEDLPCRDTDDSTPASSTKPPYTKFITVSGDGTLHELINGLLSHPRASQFLDRVSVASVPGGSANAIARNLGEGSFPYGLIRGLISGQTEKMSIVALTSHPANSPSSVTTYSHLELFWTLPADADIESERQRWAGYLRVQIQALIRLVRLRAYKGTLFWLEEDRAQDLSSGVVGEKPEGYEGFSVKPAPPDAPKTKYSHIPPERMTPSNGWKRTPSTGQHFTYFAAMRLPWAAPDSLFAPRARMGDDKVHLNWTGSTDRGKFADVFLNGEDPEKGPGGSAVSSWVQQKAVRAFALFPGPRKGRKGPRMGILDVDGEVMEDNGPVYGEVLQRGVQVCVPPWFREGVWGPVRAPWLE